MVIIVLTALAYTVCYVIKGVGGLRLKYKGWKWLEIKGF